MRPLFSTKSRVLRLGVAVGTAALALGFVALLVSLALLFWPDARARDKIPAGELSDALELLAPEAISRAVLYEYDQNNYKVYYYGDLEAFPHKSLTEDEVRSIWRAFDDSSVPGWIAAEANWPDPATCRRGGIRLWLGGGYTAFSNFEIGEDMVWFGAPSYEDEFGSHGRSFHNPELRDVLNSLLDGIGDQ